jgi:catechol 2,3-dioxygenase-like lactoylglutathione lyase family enzyme
MVWSWYSPEIIVQWIHPDKRHTVTACSDIGHTAQEATVSTTAVAGKPSADPRVGQVDMKLEVVTIPVSDVERAKAFYESLGWRLDADFLTEDDHAIQFTPPGSQASVHFGTNLTTAAPGSAQVLLIVSDIQAARDELVRRGVAVSEVFHYAGLNRIDPSARLNGLAPERHSYRSWVSFSDPDGNSWLVQEITTRLPGRIAGETTYASVGDLAEAMRRASAAHGEHEKRIGQYDANWPDWYAAYMVAEATGGELPK